MSENVYTASITEWYDRIMAAGYYDHEKVAAALALILGNRRNVLELGVGTGLLAERLLASGYEVTGVDFTPSMLEVAERRLKGKARLFSQDVVVLDLPGTYDAAISEGGVWYVARQGDEYFLESHIASYERNCQGLAAVARHLSPRGLLVLGIQPYHQDFSGLDLGEGASYSQKVSYRGNLIERDYFVTRGEEVLATQHCTYRRFDAAEQERLLAEAGFIPIGRDASDQFLVLEKRG